MAAVCARRALWRRRVEMGCRWRPTTEGTGRGGAAGGRPVQLRGGRYMPGVPFKRRDPVQCVAPSPQGNTQPITHPPPRRAPAPRPPQRGPLRRRWPAAAAGVCLHGPPVHGPADVQQPRRHAQRVRAAAAVCDARLGSGTAGGPRLPPATPAEPWQALRSRLLGNTACCATLLRASPDSLAGARRPGRGSGKHGTGRLSPFRFRADAWAPRTLCACV
jgi:hypothetical protein